MAKISTYSIEPVTTYRVIESYADDEANSGGVNHLAECAHEEDAQKVINALQGAV